MISPVATIGIVFAALLVTGALLQPWVGSLSDRMGRGPVLVIGNATAALCVAILAFDPPVWLMVPAMTVGVAALDVIRAAMLAAAVDPRSVAKGRHSA
ncbi:MAG: MFS transporter [Paracoccaceae bacterium]